MDAFSCDVRNPCSLTNADADLLAQMKLLPLPRRGSQRHAVTVDIAEDAEAGAEDRIKEIIIPWELFPSITV